MRKNPDNIYKVSRVWNSYTRNPFSLELEYIFKYALTQEVAYNCLFLKKRKEFQRRIREAIEELYAEALPEHLGPLAFHFYQAEDGLPHQNQYD